ncbi:hypothetical protein CEXT_701801 [Caerostris extrusa]|uniref:Uncharacterized protein n=1 Tax=Caerostris extrusa TaxID=172846 RepID=A0AAV4Y3E4_CAEEX|nr:hypothetical protein CEXT_701801 [Caerostris extrusa]
MLKDKPSESKALKMFLKTCMTRKFYDVDLQSMEMFIIVATHGKPDSPHRKRSLSRPSLHGKIFSPTTNINPSASPIRQFFVHEPETTLRQSSLCCCCIHSCALFLCACGGLYFPVIPDRRDDSCDLPSVSCWISWGSPVDGWPWAQA